ncbi:hypothetical protein [Variovorax boronicumulans]|uniref:hypothetical protein n=1 Tax=Variovorax boronicumulans TaxID=436515 RepID=UPI0027D92DDB|nr:hypothetical protein [Variovorax boronicumulans]
MSASPQATDSVFQQKLCVARLMDGHPEAFAASACGRSWVELVETAAPLVGANRRTVDQALGMIGALFRSTQMAMGDVPTPGQMFAADRTGAAETVRADPAVFELVGPDSEEDPESIALAKSLTLYKQAADVGLVSSGELAGYLDAALLEQPGKTTLAQHVKDVARQMMAIEVERLLVHREPELSR